MKYYVIGIDGNKYGPCDIDILNEWICEKRIVADTELVDKNGNSFKASEIIPELNLYISFSNDDIDIDGITITDQLAQEVLSEQSEDIVNEISEIDLSIPGNVYDDGNDSGSGDNAVLPLELSKFNWGACFLAPLWGVAHNAKYKNIVLGVFIASIIFAKVQFLGSFLMLAVIAFMFFYLVKGNEFAWKGRHFEDTAHFKYVQEIWFKWGIAAFILGALLIIQFILGWLNLYIVMSQSQK